MPKGQSLISKYPDYKVELDSSPDRIRVTFEGETLVDTEAALVVRESNHPAVLYFPRADVRFDLLERTDHATFCPFKGEASYWTLRSGDRVEENAVWSYEDPFDEVAGLKGYVAFYEDRVVFESAP